MISFLFLKQIVYLDSDIFNGPEGCLHRIENGNTLFKFQVGQTPTLRKEHGRVVSNPSHFCLNYNTYSLSDIRFRHKTRWAENGTRRKSILSTFWPGEVLKVFLKGPCLFDLVFIWHYI